jgi:hypothetical protein
VKITVNDDLVKECNVKKKYTFFEYKAYIRFFRSLYMAYIHNHPDDNTYDSYSYVNSNVSLSPSIGNSEYVVDLKYDNVRSYETARFYYSNDKRESDVEQRDPYGIPNVCFSLIDDTDTRWEQYTQQRLERGFDESETWNLDATIAKFIYPRLKVFIEDVKRVGCFPASMTFDEWLKILDDMLKGFELLVSDEIKNEDEDKIIEHSLDLFRKHFFSLWT